ncbi:hypothetical protein AVEN_71219-1 [Araneus ventricosus]|uniref:Uncharacterized protein n=1 Tax=Araneus ventricosus TaxID=182803 RepID=A0A4Y2IPC9_ARAVE|nr:hypothetical protein AVEN_71219-1 [Araneus ventricosus]
MCLGASTDTKDVIATRKLRKNRVLRPPQSFVTAGVARLFKSFVERVKITCRRINSGKSLRSLFFPPKLNKTNFLFRVFFSLSFLPFLFPPGLLSLLMVRGSEVVKKRAIKEGCSSQKHLSVNHRILSLPFFLFKDALSPEEIESASLSGFASLRLVGNVLKRATECINVE